MPRRWVRVLLIVLAAAVFFWVLGYALFNEGGTVPGSGTGETITEPSP